MAQEFAYRPNGSSRVARITQDLIWKLVEVTELEMTPNIIPLNGPVNVAPGERVEQWTLVSGIYWNPILVPKKFLFFLVKEKSGQ